MSDDQLGLTESVSMALGGMIGGGIYAVMGVVAGITGPATWAAFVTAGLVALCAGYSFVRLNAVDDEHSGGAVAFVQRFVGNQTLAGMVGWTLLFGYVGSMAMYAFAFGEFTVGFSVVPEAVAGLPTRAVVSVLAVVGFVALNLAGARATGSTETVLVVVKVGVLLLFGVGGIVFVVSGASDAPLSFGLGRLTSFGPVMAAAVSFVAFQGWQLLFYDQESIDDAGSTIPKAVYLSIPVAVAIYVLVGLTTVTLAPDALTKHPHVALAEAAGNMLAPFGYRGLGFVVISLSALFSTGSAINATLFSSGHFAKGMLDDDLLPDRLGDASGDGIPQKTLLVLGAVTAAATAYGSLGGITAFASLSFIVVFGGTSYLAFRERDREAINPIPPLVGTLGSLGFFPLMLYHLYRAERGTFFAVLLIAAAVIAVELLYFERDAVEGEVTSAEDALGI